MAMNVGSIFVDLGFKYNDRGLKNFDRDAKKANNSTTGLDKSSRNLEKTHRAGRQAAMGAAAGIAVLGAAVIKGAKANMELAASTKKLSTFTGMDNVESGKWVQIAKARGVESKALIMGFNTMSKQIVAGKNGTKAAAEAFDKLGISQRELKKMNTSQALKAISDGLAKMPDGAVLIDQLVAHTLSFSHVR